MSEFCPQWRSILTKVALFVEAPTDSVSLIFDISLSGTKEPSMSIIISKIVFITG